MAPLTHVPRSQYQYCNRPTIPVKPRPHPIHSILSSSTPWKWIPYQFLHIFYQFQIRLMESRLYPTPQIKVTCRHMNGRDCFTNDTVSTMRFADYCCPFPHVAYSKISLFIFEFDAVSHPLPRQGYGLVIARVGNKSRRMLNNSAGVSTANRGP
jgi:hypothetical protein